MSAIERFRTELRAGRVLLGPSVAFSDPMVTHALAGSVDFIWLDLEHGAMSPEAVCGHLLAARARDVPLVARLPGSHTSLIKPMLDSGVEGLVVPQVRSADEVRGIAADCRYPPVGRRGIGPIVPSDHGRLSVDEVIRVANERVFVAVQVENAEALACVDEIVAVPGIDSIVIGPMDLSTSLGKPGQFDDPVVSAAIDRVIETARRAGRFVGAGVGDAETAIRFVQRGVQWIQLGGADQYLWSHFEELAGTVHGCVGRRMGAAGAGAPA